MFAAIAIIGGFNQPGREALEDIQVISIENDSVKHVNYALVSPLKRLCSLRGAQLTNGNLLVCGGVHPSACEHSNSYSVKYDEYLLLNFGSKKWNKIETMKNTTVFSHSSASLDGRLFTTGGQTIVGDASTYHRDFSFGEGVKERQQLPIALRNHTSTIYDQENMIICGGFNKKVSNAYPKSKKKTLNQLLNNIFKLIQI